MKRKGRKSAAQTPAPPKEQIYGSKKNPKGSAASKSAASKIELSTKALEALKNKRAKFKEKYPSKDVSLNTLKAVMRRGMGAYSTSFRPTITGGKPNSRQAWGFARVNKFLEKKAGKPVKKAYVQDDDLLEKGGELKLLAPNGKPSNLTPEQYRLVRTPEFKAWFGDWENDPKNASKVVDENGEPLVVYNRGKSKFYEFNKEKQQIGWLGKGFYFSPQKDEFKEYGKTILSVFLNIKNLFIVKGESPSDVISEIKTLKNIQSFDYNDVSKPLIENNYNGIKFNHWDRGTIFTCFEPNQIKLADGTNTTFDPNNPDIRYEDGGFLQSIYEGMGNLIKNGIVLTDKSKSVSVIAYNTGNQERDKSLYNKALIYYSVKPLRQANEIIENFDNEEYSLFDVKKIEEYKNAPHLIILNQNEVVYDSNNPNIRYKEGGNTKQMFIHWTDREGLKNILSENILFEETSLTDSLKLPFDIDNNLPFGIVFKDNIYKGLYKIDEEQAGTLLEIEHEYRTKKKIIFDTYFDGFVVRNQKNRKSLESYLENSQDFWQNDNLRKYYKEKGYNIRKAESPNKYHLGGDMSKHLAPNGNPSNLTHEQWHLVRTPEFKAWFGDWENDPENASKVVDENGEPKVMYHGTLFDFNEFIPEDDFGFLIDRNIYFFTDDVNVAKGFASIKKRGKNKDKKVRIINAYINSRKPFDPEANKNEFDILYKITKYKNLADWMPNNWELLEDKKNVKKIKQLGYDSIITTETDSSVVFGKLSSSYKGKSLKNLGVFKSSQVKLADGTNTTFDPNNPDIRFAYGGRVLSSKLMMPKVRGGWTKEKILKYLKSHSSDTISTFTLTKYISEFDNWEQLKDHIYYHGTTNYIEKGLKPSITFSERFAERQGGGGYGMRYWGISLTKRKRTAENFSGMERYVSIYPVILKRDAKVIERTDISDSSEIEDIIVDLYDKGVDAVWIGGGEEELVVINPSCILLYKKGSESHQVYGGLKTKQLTDDEIKTIYQQAKENWDKYSEEYNAAKTKEEKEEFLKKIPAIKFEDGGFLKSIYEGMDNLIKNGIVLTDKSKNIIVIAYNTGNQERDKSLYNKALIYYSVKPLRQANEIIENFDNEEYSLFDVKKIEEYKNAPHLIILNQNEVVYDSNNPDIRYKRGGKMKDSIALPDSYATYDKLKPILENQGYMLEKIIKPTKSIEQIAKDFSLPTSLLHKQLEIGKQHELEHTYSIELAEKTALHHLAENPFYYTHLKEMEMKVEAEKLEGYYRMGGALEGEFTCEVLDEEGERMIDPASIESLTECISNLPQTKSMHFDYEKNDYKPYRKRLHKDIIYEFKKDLMCIENAEPIAILMGGSPASGKSTFLKKFAPYLLKEDIFKIDADEIRSKLPEYRGYNASQTHLETKDIVTTLLSDRNIGLPCKFDVIYDGTMNNTKSYVPLIDLLKSLGYKVFIVYIDKVPKDVVIKRSLERYKKQGRFVPLEVIEDFFSKGKEALNELKKQVDGYMVIDGSDTEYRVMERGGKRIPRDRNYNKLGEPIKITSEEVIREFKKGGEIDPNDPAIKEAMTHKAGAAGGLLVGNRHSEGGIKAVNKSNGQPLEMEGGEVVITRNAVSDETKREFEGEMLTNREILSRINQSGGGVSFAEGGDIPEKCACSGKTYNYGGKVRSDYDIVKEINTPSLEETAMEMYAKGGMLSIPSPFGQGTLKIPTLDSFIKRGKPLESNGIAYIPKYNKVLGEVVFYRDGDKRSKKMSSFDAYRFYLMQQFNVQFEKLNNAIKTTLIK